MRLATWPATVRLTQPRISDGPISQEMKTNDPEISVLLIEDDPADAVLVSKSLGQARTPMTVHCEETLELGLAALRVIDFDIILVDLSLPDCEVQDTVQKLIPHVLDKPIVVVTGLDDLSFANTLIEAGAQDYVIKGTTSNHELERCVTYAIQRHNNVLKNRELMAELEEKHRLVARKNEQLAKLYAQAHEFVDNVSHEFRTPLTVIKEFVSLVREEMAGPVNQEQARMLAISEDRVEDLNIMVDDMLDSSKLEAGMLGTSRVACDVEDVLAKIRPWLERKGQLKDLDILWDVPSSLPKIYCDPEKVSRILTNLTINAVKFCGNPGKIEIRATANPERNEVVFAVTDNGPGLDEKAKEEIFQRFKQLDQSIESSTKGFGLGLSITKQLVDLNFGVLTVDSKPGVGSTFLFTIPINEPAEVLRRFLPGIPAKRIGAPGAIEVSMVAAAVESDCDLLNEIHAFLNCSLRKNDLLLQVTDNRWLVLLVDAHSEIEQFFQRTEEERCQLNRNRPHSALPEISWALLKSMQVSDARGFDDFSIEDLLESVSTTDFSSLDSESHLLV